MCKELNNNNVVALSAAKGAFYGQGVGIILFDGLKCNGGESTLIDCHQYRGLGIHDCHHREDAGVECDITGKHGL